MDLTQIIQSAEQGNQQAREDLIQAAYDHLRKIAAGKMRGERLDHTLTSTALVNEVSMKLLVDSQVPMSNRAHFFAYASKAMRNLLIDHARTHGRQKRGGDRKKFSFDEAMIACNEQKDDFLALDEALKELAKVDSRKSQVVEMRYFGGMGNQEIASALDISLATVKRDWEVARGWLMRELSRDDSDENSDSDSVS